jgi:penicillin-binding protein A
MSSGSRRAFATLLLGMLLSGSVIGLALAGGASPVSQIATASRATPAVLSAQTPGAAQAIAGFDPLSQRMLDGRLVSDLPGGGSAELTLEPKLQQHLAALLRTQEVPFGAVVAIAPSTGRVLAYVSHSSENPAASDVARDPGPPSASVFKLITAAALLEAGVGPGARVCYGGGSRRLTAQDLVDNRARDRSCATLSDGISFSINAIMAKLADRKLDRARLLRSAQAFGFGRTLPFDAATRQSPIDLPAERLELARTAAGFWHAHMSPLHAALIAATIANRGAMPRASMIERVLDSKGRVLRTFQPGPSRSVISPATAGTLAHMMTGTVTHGTAREAFHDGRGRPFLPGISISGKTGSLSSERPYRAYSWWVGFAPEEAPKIAVAALVVNGAKWRIKASQVAREALQTYLRGRFSSF